jgi:hypothetical protein
MRYLEGIPHDFLHFVVCEVGNIDFPRVVRGLGEQ